MRTNQRVTGIVRRGKSILLIQRLREGHEYWVFPGGGVEEGETLEQALRREMLEETSLELRSFRFLYASKQHMDVFFYECVLAEGEPQLGGPELAAQSPSNQYILRWV